MSGPPPALRAHLAREGYAVAPHVLAAAEVTAAVDALTQVFAAEEDVAEDRGWTTAAYRVAYALPLKHPVFLGLCTHPALVGWARSVLGDDCVIAAFNGLAMHPRGAGQALHRDHPVPTPGTALYLHVVCALDPFTAANGATRVVPRSQAGDRADRDPAALADEAVPVAVPAGGAVVYDGSLAHAAGANTTAGPRRALHVFFARPWVQPHWDFPGSFPEGAASALSDEQRQLLGFIGRPRRFDLDRRRVVR